MVNAAVDIRPVDKLHIGLSYRLRARRFTADRSATATAMFNLGNVSDLNAKVSYRILPSLTAFAQVDNILGRHYFIIPGIENQTRTGAIGIAYKF